MLLFAGLTAAACEPETTPSTLPPRGGEFPVLNPPPVQRVPAPLGEAYCQVNVTGTGVIDLEEDYLPAVVTCENGGANLEALKAQAIAARSVAYYNMATEGEICDSQGCQVFSCGTNPLPEAIQAVQETSGIYLMYSDTLTYGFYVAGDNNTSGPNCVGVSGSTEQWVTYNQGQSGTNVEQTELGLVIPTGDPSYGQNRGCMGQWGARCLENENGADYLEILRFYYGEDIELVQAEGACVLPVESTAGDDTGGDSSSGGGTGASSDPTNASDPTTDPSASGDGSTGVAGGTGPGGGNSTGDVPDPTGPSDPATDGVSEPALPAGFGEDATNSSCNCTSGGGGFGGAVGLALAMLGLRRRRRRA